MSKNALPYYKAYPRDFFEGTMGMDGELKGYYRLLIDIIYMKAGALPEDDRYISGLMGVSVRKWRSVKSKLVQQGKVSIKNGIISNKRADYELETTSKYREKQAENRTKHNKNNDLQKPPLNQPEPEPEPEPYIASTLLGAREDWKVVRDKCLAACKGVLRPDVVSYIPIQPVLHWINDPHHPLDLDEDILPAMRTVAARGSPSNLTTFKYFHKAAIENRDARLAGNPAPNTEAQNAKHTTRRTPSQQRHDEQVAGFQAALIELNGE